jgi:hypothetical protein
MAEECRQHSKRELLLALAERLDQVLWCLLTATDPGCNEKARNRATLEAQKFAQEADGLLHGCDCPPRPGDPDLHEFLVAVNLAVHDLGTSLHNGAEFIAAVRAKVPDATDAEILAAVRYGGALEIREIDQIDRYMMTRLQRLRQATQCGARTRGGTPCQRPAIRGRKRCRLHGGLSPGAPGGKRMEITKQGTGRATRSRSANGFDHSCNRFAKARNEENQ